MAKEAANKVVAKATPKRTTRKKVVAAAPTSEQIATRAYYIHLEGNHDPFENWLRAERELVPA